MPVTTMRCLAITILHAVPYHHLLVAGAAQAIAQASEACTVPCMLLSRLGAHCLQLDVPCCMLLSNAEPGRPAVSLLTGTCRQTQLLLPQEDASCRMSQPDAKTLVPDASSQRLLDTCLCQVHIIASHILLCLKATPLLCEPCLPACLPRHALQLQGLTLCVTLCVIPREQRAGMAQLLMVKSSAKVLGRCCLSNFWHCLAGFCCCTTSSSATRHSNRVLCTQTTQITQYQSVITWHG